MQRMRDEGVFKLDDISFPLEHRERMDIMLESKGFSAQSIGGSPMQIKGGAQADLLPAFAKLRV
jgi:hypothetical protein